MNEKLQLALVTVMEERAGRFDKSFPAVAALVADYSPDDLADRLAIDIPATVPWEVAADVLGILTWSTADNGAAIGRAAERWLVEGNDLRRAQIALNLDAYPFETNDEMRLVLAKIANRFPEISGRCQVMVDSRSRLPE
jgi:hypothetical protein